MTISRAYVLEHFDEVCERAESGEEIVLERPGKPGLALVPRPAAFDPEQARKAADAMLEFMRSRPKFDGVINYKELIEEGRRY